MALIGLLIWLANKIGVIFQEYYLFVKNVKVCAFFFSLGICAFRKKRDGKCVIYFLAKKPNQQKNR